MQQNCARRPGYTPAMLQRIVILAACLAAGVSPRARADTDPYAAARAEFLAAWSTVATAPLEPPPVDSETLRTYPLYPYLQAARLERQLAAVPVQKPDAPSAGLLPLDTAIETFLAPLGDQPAAKGLRKEWLTSLANRRAWEKYLGVYRAERDSGDVSLRCGSFAGRIALGRTEELAAAVTDTWLTAKALPDGCNPAFDWLLARGALGNELIEKRARLALAAGEPGFARYLARSLPAATAAPLLQWAGLIEQPKAAVSALIAAPERTVEKAALLDGWQRLARSDADAAAALFPSLVEARHLDERNASPFALAVGLAQAWSRGARALEFFAKVNPDDFDERGHEWHARAALWAGNWAEAARAINAMPEALRSQNRWRYWAARSAEQRGDATAAHEGYAAVLPTDNWYAVFSAARLGQPFAPTVKPLPLSDVQITVLGTEPGFVRARELLLCQLDTEAGAEWRATFDALQPEQQVQAVGLASRWGWHIQAISAAAKQGLFNDYDVLYPRPFDNDVRSAAARTGLPQALVYAIIRQESLYRANASSGAGALGLMQLLPETARRTANRADLPPPTRASLLIPSVNIPLGSEYLKSLVARAGGQVPLAVAGYNAGPGAVRRWLPATPMETDVWAENIPFNETRAYVQRVAWHALVFAWLNDRKPRDVSSWLGTIQAPAADAALSNSSAQ
jgi:soluble lytic murein transglycosylase